MAHEVEGTNAALPKKGREPIWYPSPVCTQAHDFFVSFVSNKKWPDIETMDLLILWNLMSGHLVVFHRKAFALAPLLGTRSFSC